MYSTHMLNKNMVDGNKYISVGDPYKDPPINMFRQDKKGENKPMVVHMIPQNADGGHFSKLRYASCNYHETNRYMQTQPLDKRHKGFGSKDAHRRDEFSSSIRTEQYRETLRKELILMKKQQAIAKAIKGRDVLDDLPVNKANMSESGKRTRPLYDIGRTKVTEFDPKASRDRHYKFDNAKGRKSGPYRPESFVVGSSAWDVTYKPPSNGATSQVKNFFDNSHLKVAGCR